MKARSLSGLRPVVFAVALMIGLVSGCGASGVKAGPVPGDLCRTVTSASGQSLKVADKHSSSTDDLREGSCSLTTSAGVAVEVTVERFGDTKTEAAVARTSDRLTDFCSKNSNSYVRDDDRLEGFTGTSDCMLVTDPAATDRPATAILAVGVDDNHGVITASVVLPDGTVDEADGVAQDIGKAVRTSL